MSNKNTRIIATLNFNNLNMAYIDKSFYSKASKAVSLRGVDYLLSRVTNNPSYSNSLLMEIRADSHPAFDRVNILNNSSVDHNNSLVSNKTDTSNVSDTIDFSKHIESLIIIICTMKTKVNLLKIFSYFLILSGNTKSSHPYLNKYLRYFRGDPNLNWNSCVGLVGTRWQSEKARVVFRGLYSSYLNGEEYHEETEI